MLNLDPGKLLVIGVVAIILLGPDRLPQVARQIGGAWKTFNEFRHRMETQVRDTMPDLPDTAEIARLARSPSALLNHLSNMAPDEESDEKPDGSFQPPNLNGEIADAGTVPEGAAADVVAQAPAAAGVEGDGRSNEHVQPVVETAPAPPAPIRVERPPSVPKPSGVVVPADPTLN